MPNEGHIKILLFKKKLIIINAKKHHQRKNGGKLALGFSIQWKYSVTG